MISSYGIFLGASGERLVIKKQSEVLREISAFEVSQVLLDTKGSSVSSAAMRLMLKHGVELLILRRGRLLGKLSPARRGANIHLKMRQFAVRDAKGSPEAVRGRVVRLEAEAGRVY